VGVDAGISGSTSEILAISELNVLSIRVLVALSKTEVDDIDVVPAGFSGANEEVVRLNVPVDYSLLMHLLDSLDLRQKRSAQIGGRCSSVSYQLHRDEEHCLEIELLLASLEEIF